MLNILGIFTLILLFVSPVLGGTFIVTTTEQEDAALQAKLSKRGISGETLQDLVAGAVRNYTRNIEREREKTREQALMKAFRAADESGKGRMERR